MVVTTSVVSQLKTATEVATTGDIKFSVVDHYPFGGILMIRGHDKQHSITLPNQLTIIRLFLAPLAFGTYVFGSHWFVLYWVAFCIYVVGLATDLVDGRLARWLKATSCFGRAMDSIADKTLVSSAMIALSASDKLPAVFVLLFVYRELSISGLRTIKTPDQTTIAEIKDRWGRIRFFVLHAGMLVLLFPLSPTVVQWSGTLAVGLSVAMAYGVSSYYLKRDAKALHLSMMPANRIVSGTASLAKAKGEAHEQRMENSDDD
ncbi:CDP-alcohol phosphatidyltransferase family protein [Candidatus Poribacteria bacterium]|nr:CDP-alcohol phosphatidyltransferase family protein [Candidatus Poribacteria bacterium]